jgi:four helix bundle protein
MSAGSSIAIVFRVTESEMKARTKAFSVEIVKFARALPRDAVTHEIMKQIVRSGTSVGANYRSSCRGRSTAEFIAKLGVVEDEADETLLWLEVLVDSGTVTKESAARLMNEADQIVAMMVSSIKTARLRVDNRK